MIKLALTFAFVSALAACGGSKKEESTTPPAGEATPPPDTQGTGTPMSPEECTAKGGMVKGDIGDGKVACDEGQQDLGRVNQGIEGAVCCAPGGNAASAPAAP